MLQTQLKQRLSGWAGALKYISSTNRPSLLPVGLYCYVSIHCREWNLMAQLHYLRKLLYKTYIGNGDSKAYSAIVNSLPYGVMYL